MFYRSNYSLALKNAYVAISMPYSFGKGKNLLCYYISLPNNTVLFAETLTSAERMILLRRTDIILENVKR